MQKHFLLIITVLLLMILGSCTTVESDSSPDTINGVIREAVRDGEADRPDREQGKITEPVFERIDGLQEEVLNVITGQSSVKNPGDFLIELVAAEGGRIVSSSGLELFSDENLSCGFRGEDYSGKILTGCNGGYRDYHGIAVRDRVVMIDLAGKPPGWESGSLYQAELWEAFGVEFLNPGLRLSYPPSSDIPFRTYRSAVPFHFNGLFASSNTGRESGLKFVFGYPESPGRWARDYALFLELGRNAKRTGGFLPLSVTVSPNRRIPHEFRTAGRFNEDLPFRKERSGTLLVPPETGGQLRVEYTAVNGRTYPVPGNFSPEDLIGLLDPEEPENRKENRLLLGLLNEFDKTLKTGSIDEDPAPYTELPEYDLLIESLADRLEGQVSIGGGEAGKMLTDLFHEEDMNILNLLFSENGAFHDLVSRRQALREAAGFLSRMDPGSALEKALFLIPGARTASAFTPEVVKKAGLVYPADLSPLIISIELKHSGDDFSGEIRELEFWIEQYDKSITQVIKAGLEIVEGN